MPRKKLSSNVPRQQVTHRKSTLLLQQKNLKLKKKPPTGSGFLRCSMVPRCC